MKRTMHLITYILLVFISLPSLNYASTIYSSRSVRQEAPATNIPIMVTEPKVFTVREGETAVLPCDIKDLAPLLSVWSKEPEMALFAGSFPLQSSDKRFKYSSQTEENNTLTKLIIEGVQLRDSGNYTCKVGLEKQPIKVTHILNVLAPPHVKTFPDSGVLSIHKGETINLTCIATGNPIPTVVWRKREGMLPQGVKNEGESLIITNASRKDSGIYECTASNVAHGEMTQAFRVQTHYEPEIIVKQPIVFSGINQSAVLICEVYSDPSAHVHWSKSNGEVISPSDKYIIFRNLTIATLTIQIQSIDEFDNYMCTANNSLGRTSDVIELVGKPSDTKITSEEIAYTENEYLLSWEITSYSPIKKYAIRYKSDSDNSITNGWKKMELYPSEGQEGPVYTERTLLNDLKQERYVIQVQAENDFGWNRPNPEFAFTLVGPSKNTNKSSSLNHSSLLTIILATLMAMTLFML